MNPMSMAELELEFTIAFNMKLADITRSVQVHGSTVSSKFNGIMHIRVLNHADGLEYLMLG